MAYTIIEIGELILVLLFVAFIVGSIVLFIVDGIKAKRESRKRKVWIIAMFIVALIFIAIAIMMGIMVSLLTAAIMRSM